MNDEKLKEFLLYQYKVRKLTRKNAKNFYIEGQNLKEQGFDVELDHRISIKESFEIDMPIELCSDPSNLQYISRNKNRIKGAKSTQTLSDLLENLADQNDFS